jgi:ubiquinone biosynthesis protein
MGAHSTARADRRERSSRSRLQPLDTPTRLLAGHERPPVVIGTPTRPSPYRSLWVLGKFLVVSAAIAYRGLRRELTAELYGRMIRDTCEEIGGLWIKVAQLFSLRIDVFPLGFCRELSRIQERSIGFSGTIARGVVESNLGAPVEREFAEFDDMPFAVVPWGQVHRARLRRENVWVAVKVQQPYLRELFARDMALIRRLARMLVLFRVYLHIRWQDGLNELEQMAREDLDFQFEASSMRRMRRTLRRHGVYVPRLFSRYCGPRVLVSEFIHAVLMSDYLSLEDSPERLRSWVAENQIDLQRVGQRLFGSLLRQLFEDNLYHGDLRPENIVLLRNSRVALVDFRSVHFTERGYLEKYRLFVHALGTRDYAKAADLAFMLCAMLPVIDIELTKEKVIRVLRAWATRTVVRELPYHERSIDHATSEVVRVLFASKCTMEWDWLRIHRTMSMLDVSLASLTPDLNHTRQTLRYFRRANRRSVAQLIGPQLYERTLGSIRMALDIQERINEYTMFQSSLIRRHAQVFQGATNKFADTVATLVGGVAIAILVPGIALVGILLGQRAPAATEFLLGRQIVDAIAGTPVVDARVAFVLLVLDVYFFAVFQRLKSRLRQKDVRQHERVASF